jgi:hypothetical protein
MFRKVSDFDGDGRADFAVIRDEFGSKIWYVWQSTSGFKVIHWGTGFDISAAGDYNADGVTDFAIYRDTSTFPPLYAFHILESGTNIYTIKSFSALSNFGSRIVHQDYNGDGRVDAALNLGEFGLTTQLHVQYSGTAGSGFATSIPSRGVPVRLGDLDGDGIADIAHYNVDTFLITVRNSTNGGIHIFQFGIQGDRHVMADFDGDGVGELAVFRPSTGVWWWIRSSDGQVNAAKWGSSGDTPVPADYDGDGKTDLAVWRPGAPQATFWVFGSQNGLMVVPWGLGNDRVTSFAEAGSADVAAGKGGLETDEQIHHRDQEPRRRRSEGVIEGAEMAQLVGAVRQERSPLSLRPGSIR